MSNTAALIKRLLARKLTQSEISRRTGIPQPRISRWAAGEVPDAADDSLKLKALDDELPPPESETAANDTAAAPLDEAHAAQG